MERKLSKKMPSNSRPPLTSRIRASFDGKRSKSIERSKSEVTSPTLGTNGFITQDPEALQSAVERTMNSTAFQDAIAANLAKLLKPTIKSALDTIQPVVETVYNHEVLLRQTNKSVENLLERLDPVAEGVEEESNAGDPQTPTPASPRRRTIGLSSNGPNLDGIKQLLEEDNAHMAARFQELSAKVEANNNKVTEALEGIKNINAVLHPTQDGLNSLKPIFEQSHTATSVIQAQLDQLNADVGAILDAVGTDLGSNVKTLSQNSRTADASILSDHTEKLDSISRNVAALKDHTEIIDMLRDIVINLETLDDRVQASTDTHKEHLAAISPQLEGVLDSLQLQSSTLSDIKAVDFPSAEILAALQKSNDSHAAHAITLGQIKDLRSTPEVPPVDSASESQTLAALEALQAEIATLKDNIQTGLTTTQEEFTGLGTKVDDVLTTLEAHRVTDTSADILAEVRQSNASHALHASALERIKSLNVANAPSDGPHISTIASTLESHTAALHTIQDSIQNRGIASTGSTYGLGTFETSISEIATTLESHTIILNELKDDVSAEILTILNEQNSILAELREGDMSEEILTALHASNDSHTAHTTALSDLHAAVQASNVSHKAHAGVLDELRSARSTEQTAVDEGTSSPQDLEAVETQLGAIMTSLDDQKIALSAIKEATLTHIDSLGGHAAALAEIKAVTHSSKDWHETHMSALADINSAVTASISSHASHAAILAEIKGVSLEANDLHASHVKTLTELKSAVSDTTARPPEDNATDTKALETSIDAILSTLDAQSNILSQIKETATSVDTLTVVKETHELVQSQNSLLSSKDGEEFQRELLENISSLREIIEDSKASLAEHGASVKDLHESTAASKSEITQAIAALSLAGAAGAGAGAILSQDDDKSSEILEQILAVKTIVEKSSTSADDGKSGQILEHVTAVKSIVEKSSTTVDGLRDSTSAIAAQIDINHTTITTSITTLSDELKAEVDATGTAITDSLNVLGDNVKSIDLSSLSTKAIENQQVMKEISSLLGAVHDDIKASGNHMAGLTDGFHLNDKGVSQLKEHVTNTLSPSSTSRRPNEVQSQWEESRKSDVASVDASGHNHETLPIPIPDIKGDSAVVVTHSDQVLEEDAVPNQSPVETIDPEIAASTVAKDSSASEQAKDDGATLETNSEAEIESAADKEVKPVSGPALILENQAEPLVEEAEDNSTGTEEPAKIEDRVQGEKAIDKDNSIPKDGISKDAVEPVQNEGSVQQDGATEEEEPAQAEGSHQKVDLVKADEEATKYPSVKDEENEISEPLVASPDTTKEAIAESPRSAIFAPESPKEDPETTSKMTEAPDEPLSDPKSPGFSEAETESASTSAIASPTSPSFPGKSGKKGKKDKKEKKEKKGKKDKKTAFVFDPEDDDESTAIS
ncbi:hypothetical protein B0O99DRAFT_226050 [Bisporella sp. PMI_857]|nr:hypothetical protein B0O99DRAFT_226050 [Bisporella sp. PMI_857]